MTLNHVTDLYVEKLAAASRDLVEHFASPSNEFVAQKIAFDALDGTDQVARGAAAGGDSCHGGCYRAQPAAADSGPTAQVVLREISRVQTRPMLSNVSAIFRGLTMDSFSRLLAGFEEASPRLFGIRPNGEQVDVAGMNLQCRPVAL